jgi:asparagine synthase (glutamine-hydrolysing)
MPGIVGLLGRHVHSTMHLDLMAQVLRGGADVVKGRLHDAASGVHVAWGAHGRASVGVPPIRSADGHVTLVFDGEVFDTGGAGMAAYLLRQYDAVGEDFVRRLNGTFAGLLIDRRRGFVLLFNDRFGASRLYVHECSEGIYFASRAAALLRALPALRRLDPAAVAQTFSLGCTLGERSLFQGVKLLPPASLWRCRGSSVVHKQTYFVPAEWQEQQPLEDAQFPQALHDTFSSVLPDYLRSEVAPAMSLTGGIDGRMIMACAKPEPSSIPCYSFGGMYRDCHDVKLARRIAQLCGQSHRTLTAGPQMLAEFPSLAEECIEVSDGTMDVSGAVELYVNRLARQTSPLRITGNYGSEIVRGNIAFRPRALPTGMLEPELERMVDAASTEYHEARRSGDDLTFVAFKQVPWHHQSRLSVERSVLMLRSPYLDNRLVSLMFRASVAMRRSREPSLWVIQRAHAALAALPTDRGLVLGHPSVVAHIRHSLREFSAKAEYAYDYGMPPALVRLDRLLSPLHPERLFLGRHKFYHFRIWYRRELAPWVREVLLSPRSETLAWYRTGALRRMVDDHIAGRANRTLDLHRALTLELVHRRLLNSTGDCYTRQQLQGVRTAEALA